MMYPSVQGQEFKTPKGLGWCLIAFGLYLGVLGVQIAVAAFTASALASVGPGASPGQVFTSFAILASLGIISFVLLLLVLIFYFLGFGNLYGGRNEHGPAHARNVRLSLWILIVAMVVGVAGYVVQFALLIGAIFGGFFGGQVDPGELFRAVAIGTTFAVVTAALVAALLVLSVRALAHPSHQKFLYLAAGLGTATPGVVGAVTLLQLPQLIDPLSGPGFVPTLDPTAGIPSLLGGVLGVVTFALFLLAYRGAHKRILSGDLKPLLPIGPTPWMPVPAVPSVPPPTGPEPPASAPAGPLGPS